MESKQHMTRPFWTSTFGGGCAKRHSSSVREHLFRVNSRHTSSVNHRESFTFGAAVVAGVAWYTIGLIIGLTTAISGRLISAENEDGVTPETSSGARLSQELEQRQQEDMQVQLASYFGWNDPQLEYTTRETNAIRYQFIKPAGHNFT